MENKVKTLIRAIFTHLEKGDKTFWDFFDEDVLWVVEGTHPLAGKYKSLSEFKKATFDRLNQVLASPIKFKVREIIAEGMRGVVVMDGESTTQDGSPFHNRYCWVLTFGPNDKIEHVDAFLDTQLINDLFTAKARR
ncbi:nuclear transport factor 2 family protein [Candidatus Protochlamydia phocaeensis]|uniref:nuclear transport factor 2 family protein n=1 Tax=Candidatus Protochlamydia phocaeensis TaxID=1414722 RepID=UPI0008382026|nr:nuclear transport factor 2 family protein [Candidatus Protochlamydia phocaeensis]